MKDVYSLRKEDIVKLKKQGLITDETYIGEDGTSEIDGATLYFIALNTSEERDKIYDFIFGK